MKEAITKEEVITMIRMVGRLEGIAFSMKSGEAQNALLDTLEVMNPILDKMLEAL